MQEGAQLARVCSSIPIAQAPLDRGRQFPFGVLSPQGKVCFPLGGELVGELAPHCWELMLQETGVFRRKAASTLCFAPGSEGAVCCTLTTRTLVLRGADSLSYSTSEACAYRAFLPRWSRWVFGTMLWEAGPVS